MEAQKQVIDQPHLTTISSRWGILSFLTLISAVLLIAPTNTPAQTCFALIQGPIVIDVEACVQVDPAGYFSRFSKPSMSWLKDLDKAGKQKLYREYTGTLVDGFVVNSKASKKDIPNSSGVLAGESVRIFLPKVTGSCKKLRNHRMSIQLAQQCCTGGSKAPCLLNTAYYAKNILPGGKAPKNSPIYNAKNARKEPVSKQQDKADKLFRLRSYKKAAVIYSRAFKRGKLNTVGHYNFAFSLRQLDRCPLAIKPLRFLHKQFINTTYWPQNEMTVRNATMLLARCYAKMNRPERATLILNGFLNQPRKYQAELKTALSHPDFGWIRSTKEYQEFRESAFKLTNQKPFRDQ